MTDTRHYIAPFIGGLNTEQSNVQDLPATTSDELNCSIYPGLIRGRRYGMNIERNGKVIRMTNKDKPRVFQGYFWMNVGKTATDFIVYQVDTMLAFFTANVRPFSESMNKVILDISKYVTDINNFYRYPIKFITGGGYLIAVSKYMEPLKISYNFDAGQFDVEIINMQIRDLDGVPDGLKVDETPVSLTDYHHYNLLNQGWTDTNINAYHTNQSNYPPNNFQWFIGKDSSGSYSTTELLKHYFGNTPAPKGHFIVNYFNKNRSVVSGITSGSARTATYAYSCYGWNGKILAETPIKTFTQEISNSTGTATTCQVQFSRLSRRIEPQAIGPYFGDVTLYVEAWNGTDWNTIYSTTHYFTGTGDSENPGQEWFTMSFTNTTSYEKYRIRVIFSEMTYIPNSGWSNRLPASVTCNVRLPILQDGDPFADLAITGNDRCIDVAYMAGKFFYLAGDTVLFSQNINDDGTGFDKCHQDADPTSEDVSDVLPTDGGYIKFNTMGDGLALKTFNRGVLVFGRDVVWGLVSPLESRFTATDYDTVELSRAGLIGAQSVVSVANFVYYWSPLGIFRVGVNQQTGSTMVAENISQQTIQSFYNNISDLSKQLCRGVFDYCNNRIYWFYPEDPENAPDNLNLALVYDLNYNAFMPQDISEGGDVTAVFETVNSYLIQPTVYLRAGEDRVVAGDEFVVALADEDELYSRHTAVCHCALINLGDGDYTTSYDTEMSNTGFTVSNVYGKLNKITISTDAGESETADIAVSGGNHLLRTFLNVSLSETPVVLNVNPADNYDKYQILYTSLANPVHLHVTYEITPENDQYGITFADFNSREFIDWDKEPYDSYMVSHPITIEGTSAYGTEYGGTFNNKQVPILQTLFSRTEQIALTDGGYTTPSGAYIRMRWGWSLHGLSNRWDIVQNAYRPQKDFLHDEFVESRIHIRGRGRAYQIEIRNDSNKDFRLAGMNSLVRTQG